MSFSFLARFSKKQRMKKNIRKEREENASQKNTAADREYIEESTKALHPITEDALAVKTYNDLYKALVNLILTHLRLQTTGSLIPESFRLSDDSLQQSMFHFCQRAMHALWNALTGRGMFAANLHLVQLTITEGMASMLIADARGSSHECLGWPVIHQYRVDDTSSIAKVLGSFMSGGMMARDYARGNMVIDISESWGKGLEPQVHDALVEASKSRSFQLVLQVYNGEMVVFGQHVVSSDAYHRSVYMPPEVVKLVEEENLLALSNLPHLVAAWYLANLTNQKKNVENIIFPQGKKKQRRSSNGRFVKDVKNDQENPGKE